MEELTKKVTEETKEAVEKTKNLALGVPGNIRQGTKKIDSFFAKVSADAWIISATILLGSLFIVAAVMPVDTRDMKKDGGQKEEAEAGAQVPTKQIGETTIDNDPIIGDRQNAKVAIVEFSDFECPFCKKFHEESYQALIDKYVTTGKAVWVARDLPLAFHDPVATTSAGIANCVFTQKGSQAYFALTTEMYKNTIANGKGIPPATLDKLITAQGLTPATVKTCAATEEVKSEITADIDAASTIGIEGTPSFVIGTVDGEGKVTGEVVVGAQPLASFEKIIDKYLQ